MTQQNLNFGTTAANDGEDLLSAFTKIQANFVELYAGSGTVSHAITDVASAATCDIGAAATDRVRITGSVTITSFGTSANKLRFVHFDAAPTLTYNATTLILPEGTNKSVQAGDAAIFSSDASGNWRCLDYHTTTLTAFDGVDQSADRLSVYDVSAGAFKSTLARNLFKNDPGEIGYWTDGSPAGVMHNFRDKVRVGDACDYDGTQTPAASSANRSWVGLNALGYGTMAYFDSRSQFAAFTTHGHIAGAFAVRTSDNSGTENNNIGVAAFADNDSTATALSAWGYYGHAVKRSGVSGFTTGLELDIANQSSASVALDPYQMGNTGTTALMWLGAGGESAQLEPITHYASNVCIGIVTSGDSLATAWAGGQVISATGTLRQNDDKLYTAASTGTTGATPPTHTSGTVSDGAVNWTFFRYITPSRFKKGIVFQNISLEGTDGDGTGTAIAMEMARGHELRWKYGGGESANALLIRADGNDAARQSRLISDATGFSLKGVQSDLATENHLFRVIAPTITGSNATNFLTVTPTQTAGGLVTVSAANSTDTNVSVNVVSKGSGTVQANGAAVYAAGGTDVAVADGGTGASTAAAAATNLGLGTGDSPQFTAVNVGHATDTTITRTGAGDIAVEGNAIYRAGGTDVPIADGGTGSSTAQGAAANLTSAYTLAHSAVAVSHTGDTNETTLATVTVPANAMGPNGYVEIEAIYSNNNSGNNKTPRIRFGGDAGTLYYAVAQTTNINMQTLVRISNVNAANSQKGHTSATAVAYGATTGALTTSAVDTTAAVDIKLRGILANSGDTIALERYIVRVFYGA